MKKSSQEFQEVAHCGGQFLVHTRTNAEGKREVSFGVRHSRPVAMAVFGVYALPQGVAVGTIHLGGIGQPWNAPPLPSCVPVLIGSDSLGMFGHRCPACNGYWRSGGLPTRWEATCPYCGVALRSHDTLTAGQTAYLVAFCKLVTDALHSEHDGDHAIDMDEVADASISAGPRPSFYYAEETQQKLLECAACGHTSDILGRYAYCSTCGTYNGAAELESDVNAERRKLAVSTDYPAAVTALVSAFDSFARSVAKQLSSRIPMTPARRKEWSQKMFHGVPQSAEAFRSTFDISMLRGVPEADTALAHRLFLRRHVYEHNGGEVDARYIEESGDKTVRLKQVITETRESASCLADIVLRFGRNIMDGFHEIFPVQQVAIRSKRPRPQSL